MALYRPRPHREDRPEVLAAFLAAHPFATLVSHAAGDLWVTHLPLTLDAAAGTLVGHVARANGHWRALEAEPACLAVFHGPHAYVSSRWYDPPTSIPTWNYQAVHVRGRARLVHDPAALGEMVHDLTRRFEPAATLTDPGYDADKLRAVVGVVVEVGGIEGKFKLSQNRSAEDQARVAARLAASERCEDRETARAMEGLVAPRAETRG